MSHASRGIVVRTVLLVALALALLFGLRGLPAAAADGEARVTVVRELTERRAEYSSTYLLSSGAFRTVFSQAPVNYEDAGGRWQPVDTAFALTADGAYETAAAPVTVTIPGEASGAAPVTLEGPGGTLTLDLLGAREEAALVAGDQARYSAVLPATELLYEATGDGLKETLVLASSAAPESFTFTVGHPGLTLRADERGHWGLYAEGAREPAYLLGAFNVCDSSADEAGEPAWCDGAEMKVDPDKGQSTITYSLPRAWLEDAARVYPVKIDPSFATRSPTDIYISSGHPGVAYGTDDAQHLLCGEVSTDMGTCKTLVRFPQVNEHANVADNAHVCAATLSLWQYWQPANPHDRAHVYRIYGDSTNWGESDTWNSVTITGKQEISPDQLAVHGEAELDVACAKAVQGWVAHDYANRGFLVAQRSTEGTTYARKFHSGEYGTAGERPRLEVIWEEPTMNSSAPSSSYVVGDTVAVTVDVAGVATPAQITEIRMGVNRTAANAELRRGVLAWFAAPPSGDAHWVYQSADTGGGYFAYYNSTDYGSDRIEPLLESCTVTSDHTSATFAFKPAETWGDPGSSQMDTRLGMAAGTGSWSSGWVSQTQHTFIADADAGTPAALTCLTSSTTATSAWFVGAGANDSSTQGRGAVTLSWPEVPLADSYKVYLWDGAKYDRVDDPANPVTGTSWTTSGKNLFPTDSAIAAIAPGYSDDPFSAYGSTELRDNPSLLYQKMAGSANLDTDFRFKVVPYDAGTATSPSLDDCAALRVTLDNRSVLDPAKEDPRHVTCDLGEWDGHEAGAELDSGTLTVAVTDLAVASWGPEAAVSRTYRSSVTAAGKFAPGWFFAFEQNLQFSPQQNPTSITFTDAGRLTHIFRGSGSVWSAPNGFLATLAPDGSNWKLGFFDQSYLTFDAAGKLLSETDKNGNPVTYTWTGGEVTRITAANAQYIDLTYSSGKLSGASYATAAGTRSVTYTTAAPWRTTYFPGTAVERKVLYGYDASTRLSSLTQENWPAAGQSACESFLYSGSSISQLRYADYHATTKPDARVLFSYDSATQATVTRYGSVNGVANQEMNQEVLTWSAASAGVPRQLVSRTTDASGLALTETCAYAFDRQLATTTSSEGGLTSDTIDLAHNATSSTQTTGSLEADNQTSTCAYDALHRVVTETSYQSPTVYSVTTSTYTGADLTASEIADENVVTLSSTTYSYDAYGRQTQENRYVSGGKHGGLWTRADFSDFALCGEPQTTSATGVKLSVGGGGQTLTRTAVYDAFGNLLSEADWGGRPTATNTFDLAGNQLTSTDAAGVVTHTAYDRMGNAIEGYQTAPGTQVKANWTTSTYDAMGRALAVTTKRCDASGNSTTDRITTTTYDGAGNQLTVDDTALGGQDEKALYDADANITEEWSAGVYDYTVAGRSTRSVYDAEGDVTYESEPGNANAPGSGAVCTASTYDDAGDLLSEKQPDGTKKGYAYDGQGGGTVTEGEATATADFLPWDEATKFDAAGRAIKQTDAAQNHTGLETTTTLDYLGRVTAQTALRDGATQQSPTTTTYNDLDWVLRSVDANGVTTSTTYDAHGAVVSETIGTRTTTMTYDAASGRLLTRTDSGGTAVTYTYDAFGNVTRELHQSGGVTLKDIGGPSGVLYDSLGRPKSQTEFVSGLARTWTYPQNSASGTQETLVYGASPNTSLALARNGREIETSRTATITTGTTVTLAVADSTSGRDAADRWKQRTITQSGRAAQAQNRSFDAAGRLAAQSGLGFSSAGSYTYDANSGRKSAESLPLTLLDYPGSPYVASDYAYYPGGALATATTNGVAGSFTFDEVGNLVRDAESDAEDDTGTTVFAYDAADRLTHSDLDGGDGGALVTTYYGWDAQNAWRTSQGPQTDPAQRPVQMTYTAQGRLATYANADTATSAVYTYDAAGQRTRSVVTVNATTTTTLFAYEGLTLMSLSATQGATSWRIDYLYDEEGTPWGGVYRSSASSTNPTYFTLVTSDRGDVVCLCDSDGAAFAAYRYDAWGLPQGAGNYATGIWTDADGTNLITSTLAGQIASRQVLRYAGYAFDSESALYYCSARFYDPATRQWTTGDPAKADGEESAYQYCGGEPVVEVDASGEMPVLG